jgi:hypothetical protein
MPLMRTKTSAAESIAIGGAMKYIHQLSQVFATAAEANVRAGFMLIPEIGASRDIYVATRNPAKNGVKLASFLEFVVTKTIVIIRKEMANSATKEMPAPI